MEINIASRRSINITRIAIIIGVSGMIKGTVMTYISGNTSVSLTQDCTDDIFRKPLNVNKTNCGFISVYCLLVLFISLEHKFTNEGRDFNSFALSFFCLEILVFLYKDNVRVTYILLTSFKMLNTSLSLMRWTFTVQ